MIYLDTHVIVWYFMNDKARFPDTLQAFMNQHDWLISPIVRLELQYLFEIGRIKVEPNKIIEGVSKGSGLAVCRKPFDPVISAAFEQSWTRDPFDRILVAHASLNDNVLITQDHNIHANYPKARWEL